MHGTLSLSERMEVAEGMDLEVSPPPEFLVGFIVRGVILPVAVAIGW